MGISDKLGKLVAPVPRQTAPSDSAPANDSAHDDLKRSVNSLARQVGQLRGLVHQQAEMLTEALQRAGWQSDEEVAQQRSLQRALRALDGHDDIIAGPWTGEVGFELLYWIPFLGWLSEQ